MPAIKKTDVFKKWMKKLKDHIGKAHREEDDENE